jgi:hypothetical protein
MKIIGALLSIACHAVAYAFGGALYSIAWGVLVGGFWGLLAGVPLIFSDFSAPFSMMVGGAVVTGAVGVVGGFVSFFVAGLVQGVREEIFFLKSLELEQRLTVAMLAAAFCAAGGLATGALCGLFFSATPVFAFLSGLLSGPTPYQAGAVYGSATGFVFGLFIGALWPDMVTKAHARWREWRQKL